MYDQVHTCQNCHNPFVYSVYEQLQRGKKFSDKPAGRADSLPVYCPICTSIKASERLHPPKPKK